MTPGDIPHDEIRERRDRSWTLRLLDLVRDERVPAEERDEAFATIWELNDPRATQPLRAILEDAGLPVEQRTRAAGALWYWDTKEESGRLRAWWASGDPVLMRHSVEHMGRPELDILVPVAADDGHPLQACALRSLEFAGDEPRLERLKIRALSHRDAAVRKAAADSLAMDEPVAAEEPLLAALADPSTEVAAAAADVLAFYRTRRVLRALSQLRGSTGDELARQAGESFDELKRSFEWAARQPDAPAAVRRWLAPVMDLIDRTGDRDGDGPEEDDVVRGAPARDPSVPVPELMALLNDPDADWQPALSSLERRWDTVPHDQREALAARMASHDHPDVGLAAAAALGEWSRTDLLLPLTSDPRRLVRSAAVAALAWVPPDPGLAPLASAQVQTATSIPASEALVAYVHHAVPAEATARLVDIARRDTREGLRTSAVGELVKRRAVAEVAGLADLLAQPPSVTWMLHIEILEAFRRLGIGPPDLGHLREVDHLDLVEALFAHDPDAPPPRWLAAGGEE